MFQIPNFEGDFPSTPSTSTIKKKYVSNSSKIIYAKKISSKFTFVCSLVRFTSGTLFAGIITELAVVVEKN